MAVEKQISKNPYLTDLDKPITQEQRQKLRMLCTNLEKLQTESLNQKQKEELVNELDDLWEIIENVANYAKVDIYNRYSGSVHEIVFPEKLEDKIASELKYGAPDELIAEEVEEYEYQSLQREAFLEKIITIIKLVTNEDYYEVVLGKGISNRGKSVKLLEEIVADTGRNGVSCTERAWKSFKKFFRSKGYGEMMEQFNYDKKKQRLNTKISVGKLFIRT